MSKTLKILAVIWIAGVIIRFIDFHRSVYFGYDEARDAYISQEIFTQQDLKISGPSASAIAGINHGPIYYYLLGPLFLAGKGDPYVVSAFFRLLNSMGIILVFGIGLLLKSKKTGLIAAFIFAFSFEQHQYAIFPSNPTMGNFFWIIMFFGASLVYRLKRFRSIGSWLIVFSACFIMQFDLLNGYAIFAAAIVIFILRKKINYWVLGLGLFPIITYPLAEIKYSFLGIKTVVRLFSNQYTIIGPTGNIVQILMANFLKLFNNNIIKLNETIEWILFGIMILTLVIKSINDQSIKLVLVWIFSIFFLVMAKGFMPFYSFAGVGVGVIIGASIIINNFPKYLLFSSLIIIAFFNWNRIKIQAPNGLLPEIKTQTGMMLNHQIDIIKRTYEYAGNRPFTIRTTTMPYKVQTVWAYLFKQYGETYGYLPLYETGNIDGFAGELPEVKKGTTCVRFLIREPTGGIPEHLVINDVNEENYFSKLVKTEKVGEFILEYRMAKENDCL